jgi:hypothetical protein
VIVLANCLLEIASGARYSFRAPIAMNTGSLWIITQSGLAPLVLRDPLDEGFTAHKLAAPEAHGGDGRAVMDAAGNYVRHMRAGAMEKLGDSRQR